MIVMYDIIALLLFVVALLLIFYIIYLRKEVDLRAEKRFNEMKDQLSKQVLAQSRATLKGKISEQIVPFLEQFRYNPARAKKTAPTFYQYVLTILKSREFQTRLGMLIGNEKA